MRRGLGERKRGPSTVSAPKRAIPKFPLVGIVVLNWNGFDDSSGCIESLLTLDYPRFDIILVDNASPDESGPALHKAFPRVCYVQSDENGGYAKGMNLGARTALERGSDHVVLMNNDTVATPGFLRPLVEVLERRQSAGIVSPKVLYKDRTDLIYCAGARVDLLRCGGVSIDQGRPAKAYGNVERQTTMAEGSCLCVRKDVFHTVGFLDTKYFMYFEDAEFSMRVRRSYQIIYVPQSIIYHKSGAGRGWLAHTALYQYYYTRNRLWFFSSFSVFYRAYVLLFSFGTALLKSFVLWRNRGRIRGGFATSAKSLWRGFFDGTTLLFGRKRS